MRRDSGQRSGPIAVRSAGGASAEAAAVLPRFARPRALPRRIRSSTLVGRLALATLILATATIVVWASSGPSLLVPASLRAFPGWLAGPLNGTFGRLTHDPSTLQYGISVLLITMTVAYLAALYCAPSTSMRTVVICIVALHALLLLSPPFQLTDLFNYLGYARLGVLHHLNPYTHTIADRPHDLVSRFATWHHWHSPYGPAFTAMTYPLAWLPLPVAYWTLKALTVLASLGFLAILWHCARLLGIDGPRALLLVAANPVYLVYAIGGFHNDFFMLAASTSAIGLLVAKRERASGAALAFAIGVKFTVVLLLPFLLRAAQRRLRLLGGLAIGGIPIAALTVALFGIALPNVSGQSGLITGLSIPNLAGLAAGAGGAAPTITDVFDLLVLCVLIHQLLRNPNWLSAAGWCTLALVAGLAWLMPWYTVWALPLAALAGSAKLRRTAVAFTVFATITFLPVTGLLLHSARLNPMGGSVDRRAVALQSHYY